MIPIGLTVAGCLTALLASEARERVPLVDMRAVPLAGAASGVPQDPPHAPQAAPAGAAPIPAIRLNRVFRDVALKRPVQVVSRPDRPGVLYVVEQGGRIVEIDASKEGAMSRAVADFPSLTVNSKFNEQGLLSLAFDPRVADNRKAYLWFTAGASDGKPDRNVLASVLIAKDGTFDLNSLRPLIEIEDPAWNHNGGTALFGPDGMLYVSIGDGGSGNDPWGHGQDMGALLGKIIRIDVSRDEGGRGYAVPADNPFVGREGVRPEIWASGLRNVWRMSFDRATGELWAGDVGQNAYEEIDIIVKGGNYGWRPREGFHGTRGVPDRADAKGEFIDPVAEYSHRDGVSVTGGFVCRDPACPELGGVYLYADYQFGTFWGLRAHAGAVTAGPTVILKRPRFFPASFGEGSDGTLYVCGTEKSPDGPGAIFAIVPAGEAPGPSPKSPSQPSGLK
jgi:glucose/arabinose dehydrogenase